MEKDSTVDTSEKIKMKIRPLNECENLNSVPYPMNHTFIMYVLSSESIEYVRQKWKNVCKRRQHINIL